MNDITPALKIAAREMLKHLPGVHGFGFADNEIHVYVQDDSVEIPEEVLGVPTKAVITGEIKLL